MPGFGAAGLAGLGQVYPGYLEAQDKEGKSRFSQAQGDQAQIDLMGQQALGRTLQLLGAPQGQPPQAPMPGQPSQPGMPPQPQGGPPMGQPGAPPAGPQSQFGGGGPPGQFAPQGQPQGMPQPTGGSTQMGPQGLSGQLDWRSVFQKVSQANPGAPPAVIASAVNHFLPLMNAQSQQEWRQVQLQMRGEALDIQRQRAGTAEDRAREMTRQGDERIKQGDARIKQGDERVKIAEAREARLQASTAFNQSAKLQQLTMQKQELERRIQATGDRAAMAQLNSLLTQIHKARQEAINAYSVNSNLPAADKKAMLDHMHELNAQEEAYVQQLRDRMLKGGAAPAAQPAPGEPLKPGESRVTAEPGPKPPERAPAAAPKPGDVVDGYRFKGGDPGKQESWEKVQ